MSTAQPDKAGPRKIVFADAAPASQEVLTRCLASMQGGAESATSLADLREALAADPEASGIVLAAPVEALLADLAAGQPVDQALKRARGEVTRLMYCLRQFQNRLMAVDLSHAPPAPPGLAEKLGLPGSALEALPCGAPDPVLRALAALALAEDATGGHATEFLAAKSVLPPDPEAPAPAGATLRACLALGRDAAEGDALRAELERRREAAAVADRQIRAMTGEFDSLGATLAAAKAEAADAAARAEAAESRAAELQARLAETETKLANREARIARIRASWTFRATKPIRRLGGAMRKQRHG